MGTSSVVSSVIVVNITIGCFVCILFSSFIRAG
jgi:hypothetical protein